VYILDKKEGGKRGTERGTATLKCKGSIAVLLLVGICVEGGGGGREGVLRIEVGCHIIRQGVAAGLRRKRRIPSSYVWHQVCGGFSLSEEVRLLLFVSHTGGGGGERERVIESFSLSLSRGEEFLFPGASSLAKNSGGIPLKSVPHSGRGDFHPSKQRRRRRGGWVHRPRPGE